MMSVRFRRNAANLQLLQEQVEAHDGLANAGVVSKQKTDARQRRVKY